MKRTSVAIAALALASAAGVFASGGCIEHRVKVEDPIQINVDVNLRIDERLQQFFEYENELRRRTLEQQDKDAAAKAADGGTPAPAPVKESN